MAGDLSVRVMRPDEWAAVRAVCVEALGGDESLSDLLDLLRASWSWHEEPVVFLKGIPDAFWRADAVGLRE